ncbi:MAG: mechanosensitive ion channel domain-containing protein [Dissulfurimicrobium sp.]|uniref:mechanosensitive ion channel family protein n=1 Tax=Dissulfurimicrobium TaxID=1769732 RepID=UPI003C73ADDD
MNKDGKIQTNNNFTTIKQPNCTAWMKPAVMTFFILFLTWLLGLHAHQQAIAAQNNGFSPSRTIDTLNKISRKLSSGLFDLKGLDEAEKDVIFIKEGSDDCIENTQEGLDQLKETLDALGQPLQGEPARIADQRRSLMRRKAFLESRLAECRIITLHANELIPRIETEKSNLLAKRLLHKRPDIKTLLVDESLDNLNQHIVDIRNAFLKDKGIRRLIHGYYTFLGIACLIGAVFGFWIGHTMRLRVLSCGTNGLCGKVSMVLLATCARYLPAVIPLTIFTISLGFLTGDFGAHSYSMVISYALCVYIYSRIAVRILFAPPDPATPLITLRQINTGHAVSMRTNLLLILFLPLASILFAPRVQGIPQNIYDLLDIALFSLVDFGFLWVIWPLLNIQGSKGTTRGIRIVTALLVLALFALNLLGYRNLSLFILRGTAGTLVILGALRIMRGWVWDISAGVSKGLMPWQVSIREKLGLRHDDTLPGLIWLRLMVDIVLWTTSGLLLLLVWGITGSTYSRVSALLFEGFEIGQIKIAPFRILMGGFVFFILWMLSRLIKVKIENKCTGLDITPDVREGLVTIIRYAGLVLAAVIALSVAGVDMSNLAIIAGALSVGVGFGLQNIVNNFVSGLILIFERPIKKGDWIVAGGTEGHVKRIGVRSTIVQTFDNADAIIPNSELISNQVTNWMLDERTGRVRINIGVAYGSDTKLVKRLLLDVAHAHEGIIKDGSLPTPQVWFMEFGNSSLNFQLNFYIKNINDRFNIRSDIMFEIDRIFRENGIEIPFPQRDIHIRNWPAPDLGRHEAASTSKI